MRPRPAVLHTVQRFGCRPFPTRLLTSLESAFTFRDTASPLSSAFTKTAGVYPHSSQIGTRRPLTLGHSEGDVTDKQVGGSHADPAHGYRRVVAFKYATPQRNIFSSASSCTWTISPGTKKFGTPGLYGAATSILKLATYGLRLLKHKPPREISSHATISSPWAKLRMQALKLTLVRTCLRRFSRRAAGAGSGGAATTTGAAAGASSSPSTQPIWRLSTISTTVGSTSTSSDPDRKST